VETPPSTDPSASTSAAATAASEKAAAAERWLAHVDSHFRAAYEKQVTLPFSIALEEARRKFLQSIDAAGGAACQAGRCEEAAALQFEHQKFLDCESMVPAEDLDSPSPFISEARSLFRAQVNAAYQKRMSNTGPIQARYDAFLHRNAESLLARQARSEAEVLDAKRSAIAKEWLLPASPFAKAAPPKESPAAVASNSTEEAIQWVLKVGGKLTLREGRRSAPVVLTRDIPKGRLEIEEIAFSGKGLVGEVTDPAFAHLAPLRTAASVRFIGVAAGNEAFEFLQSWTSLESLTIEAGLVTDDLAVHLSRLQSLKHLRLASCKGITSGFLSQLKGTLPNLESLQITGANLGDDCIPLLLHFKHLQSLSLNHTDITDEGAAALASLSTLKELSLIGTRVSLEGLAPLSRLKLDVLGFLSTDMPAFPFAAERLAKILPSLNGLIIAGTEISIDNIEALKGFKRIRNIDLLGNRLRPNVVEALAGLHGLESISSSSDSFDDSCITCLKDIKDLKSLSIPNSHITDGGFLQLRHCRKLRQVVVGDSTVTDAGINALERAARIIDVINTQGPGFPSRISNQRRMITATW